MDSEEMERVLERGLAGEPAGLPFRARVLEDSLAALAGRRRSYARRRIVVLSAAAVLIAGVAFLGGRYSVLRWETGAPPGAPPVTTAVAQAEGTVVVSSELVEWVNAARLFKQLGMEERVGRALDRVGRLMPADTARAGTTAGPVLGGEAAAGAGQEKQAEEVDRSGRRESLTYMNRMVAHSRGD